jgi:peroxiredoxin (alkyl hydroperoxide reductase subunit C)
MSILVTQQAPDFTAAAVLADGTIIDNFSLSSLKGKKIVLFFYPLDFTFVCPSEILAHNHRVEQFKEKGVEIVGVSVDSQYTHNAWRNTEPKDGGLGAIDFTLVADTDHSIMHAYGVVHPAGIALRASFLIDENFDVRHQVVNDLPLGRNVDEMLRMVDALSFHAENGEVCPAGWNKGDEGMNATPEGVAEYLAKNADSL